MFTEGDLINYLKTVKKFTKIDEEILATITYKKAYVKLYDEDVLISFPYKLSSEQELTKQPLLIAKDIGDFIKKHIDENSPIDSILVNPQDNKTAVLRPLQIKFLGKGEYQNVTNEKFVAFLEKYAKRYGKNNASLLIVLEGTIKIKLRSIVDWLKDNEFPFGEVILINSDNKTGIMEFFQLKPSKKAFFSIRINKNEMLSQF